MGSEIYFISVVRFEVRLASSPKHLKEVIVWQLMKKKLLRGLDFGV